MGDQKKFVSEMKGDAEEGVNPLIVGMRQSLESQIEENNRLAAAGIAPVVDPVTGYYASSSPPLHNKTGSVWVTPSDAQFILDNCSYVANGTLHQRTVTQSRVENHNRIFLNGEWDQGSPIEIVVLPDGSMYLNNGQHRLLSVVQTGARWMCVNMIYVKSAEQAMCHWLATDRNQTSRPVETALEARLLDILGEGIITSEELRAMVRAIRMFNGSFNRWTCNGKDRPLDTELTSAVRYFLAPAVECFKLIRKGHENPTKSRKIMENVMGGPVLALMILTMSRPPVDGEVGRQYKYDPKVYKFWEDIVLQNDMPGSQQRVAVQFLGDSDTSLGRIGANNIARKVAAIYNAYMEGKQVAKLPPTHGRTSKAKIAPIYIYGTEFKDRNHTIQFFYGVNEFREVANHSALRQRAARKKAAAERAAAEKKAKKKATAQVKLVGEQDGAQATA